ncbi:Gpr50 [Columba livia]|nr:Gpr50 [Columba livia]
MERLGSNGSCPGCGRDGGPSARTATALAAVLIFTIVVDVLGNALVILSVLRNKKLRNAVENIICREDEWHVEYENEASFPIGLLVSVVSKASETALHRAVQFGRTAQGRKVGLVVTPVPKRPQGPFLNALLYSDWQMEQRGGFAFLTVHQTPITSNIFVVSLSVADLVVAVYPYPLILSAIFHNGWTMGNVHCQISGFLMGLSVIGSIFNITAIAINRYCYICHSLRYDKLFNLKNTCCYLCVTWILTVVAIVPNFFVGSLQYDPRIYSCTFAQTVSTSYTITVVVVHFIVPLSIVTFCYLRIWILVIQVKHRVRQDCKQKLRAADIRNFLTMFVVFVLFAVCWGPLNFIGLAVSINPSKVQPHIPEWLFVLSYFMAYFNSCLNAVIYGLLNQNFRKEYKRILLTLRTPRMLFIDVSKGGTEGMKSKPSPAVTNNNQAEIHL